MDRNTAILDTIADPKHTYLVEEIVQETLLGKFDQYKDDGKTSQDPMIGKLQTDINFYTRSSAENRKLMDQLIANLTNAKKDPKEKGYKKATPADIERWETDIGKLQLAFVTYKGQIEQLQPILNRYLFLQYIEENRRKSMKYLRDKFVEDGDRDYLEKGVTWATEYADLVRTMV